MDVARFGDSVAMLADNQKMMDENSMRNRSYLMQELGIYHLIHSWGLIRTVVLTQYTDYRRVGHQISTTGNLAQNQTNTQRMITGRIHNRSGVAPALLGVVADFLEYQSRHNNDVDH